MRGGAILNGSRRQRVGATVARRLGALARRLSDFAVAAQALASMFRRT